MNNTLTAEMKTFSRPQRMTVFSLILTVIIFAADLTIPLGVAAAVPYMLVILLTLYIPDNKSTYVFAALTLVLALLGLYLSPPGGESWQVIVNRVLALIAILATSAVVLLHKESESKLLAAKNNLETAVKERTQEFIDARNQAEHANMVKSAFLSRMSHELRTPLNSILGFAQLLERNDINTSDASAYVDQIVKSGRHLLALITEILEYSKIEAGNTEINIARIKLGELADECINTIFPIAKTQQIKIINNINRNHPITVKADYVRLKQVLLNLLTNAIKYNSVQGSITLSCDIATVGNKRVHIGVIDTGPGISEYEQKKLFQPFSRLSHADNKAIDGVGIGLAYCKELMEQMDGSIWAKSTLGQGSEFWIDLPYTTSGNIVKTQTHPARSRDDTQVRSPEIKLLYIEDNNINLELVEGILSSTRPNYTLVSAPSGEEGVELARSLQPDMILLDMLLPGISGIEVMKIIKADDRLGETPVIAISAEASSERIEAALDSGVCEYITKPFSVEHLLEVLDASIKIKDKK